MSARNVRADKRVKTSMYANIVWYKTDVVLLILHWVSAKTDMCTRSSVQIVGCTLMAIWMHKV